MEFNRAAEQLFGISEDAAVGQEMAELVIPPSLRERHRTGLRRHLESGESTILGQRLELTGMRADGEEFPVELAVNRIAEADPPMFTGTIRDITARLQAQTEREEARGQLEAILQGVADAVTAQGPDGKLLFANEAAVRTLGFASTEELLNAPTATIMDRYDILDEDARPFPLEALPGRRALTGEDAPEAIVRFRVRATGEENWAAVKATPIRDADGKVTMAINVIEDISAHKRGEMAQRFLARSAEVLASSLDPDELLVEVANLAVPEVADWVAVELVTDSGGIDRKALAHVDPEVREWALDVSKRYPPDQDAPAGVHQVIRTGQAELYPEIPDELLREGAQDEEHYRILSEFGMRSVIIVPMTTRGRTLGALTFVSGKSGRRFDEQDVELAQELGEALCDGRRQRPPLHRALVHSAHPPGEPAACGTAGHPRRRSRRALPPDRRGQRGGRRLLRHVRDRQPRLDRGDGRRLRQGSRRGGGDRARPLHAAGGRHARAPAEPQPGRVERGAPSAARRPPFLHRRLRLLRKARPRARAWEWPAAGIRFHCCCAPTAPSRPSECPEPCSAWSRTPTSRTARSRSSPATRSSSTRTA